MNKSLKSAFGEIENLYIGWVHNPIVSVNNWATDHINAFSENLEGSNNSCREQIGKSFEQFKELRQRIKSQK